MAFLSNRHRHFQETLHVHRRNATPPAPRMSRWVQLGLGLVAMMAISSPQYVWTLFLKPFQTTTGEALPAIQWMCQNFASLPFGSPCSDQSLPSQQSLEDHLRMGQNVNTETLSMSAP
jgi:hypothetical protein